MNINLDLYKTFYCVAKNSNITKAAEELMISQPAVSKSIKTLEKQLNCELFKRSNSGVELTDIGDTIYKKIENAMMLIESAESDIKTIMNMESATLIIGASGIIINEFLMPYIVKYSEEYPSIDIKVITDNTDLIEKYYLGLVDIVFTNMPTEVPEHSNLVRLITFTNCFVANKKYKEYKNKKLLPKDLEKLPLLLLNKGTINRDRLDDYCCSNDIKLKPKMEFESNTIIKDFTIEGFGIGMLDEESIKNELENDSLFKLDIDIDLSEKYLAFFYNPNNRKRTLKKFIEMLQISKHN